MSISKQILEHIESIPLGKPFTASNLFEVSSSNNVAQALVRLVKRGVIIRVARGVYVRPKHNRYVGAVIPNSSEIAYSLAQNEGATIQVHGAEAAAQFGLTTQIPVKPIYLTNGPSRKLHMGKLQITLKHVTPRKLALAGTKAGVALTALWYLGKNQVNKNTISIIHNKLSQEQFELLSNSTHLMPAWLANALHQYKQGTVHG